MKDKLYRTFLTTRTADDWKLIKQFRNIFTKKLRVARTEYYSAFLDVNKGRYDVIWSRLNSLLHRNQSQNQVLNLKMNDKKRTGTELANEFNLFFTNMKSKGSLRDACEYMRVQNKHTIFWEPVTTDEVNSIIDNLNDSKCLDIDDIQVRPLKHVADVIAPVVTHIFNTCLTTWVFPKKMPTTKITVLFKRGDRNKFSDYRPVIYFLFSRKPWKGFAY